MIAQYAVRVLDTTHYFGAGFLMALESMVFPVPSEAVMPFVGFQVAAGKWHLGWAMFATSLGSLIGSLLSYAMGYYGGKPFVLNFGRYFLLQPEDLQRSEQFFSRQRGAWIILIARFVPVIRHLISIPAGMARMKLLPFMIATVIGASLWNGFLLYCGMRLHENWTQVMQYSHQIDIVIVLIMLFFIGKFIRARLTTR